MVEWNGIFRLFRFSGILGQPREIHPKFRNEIPENVCSIRSQTRNFRNFWSNGKRPISSDSVYDSVAYDPVKTGLSESEAEAEDPTNRKARNRTLSLVYSSASACDSDNAVFT